MIRVTAYQCDFCKDGSKLYLSQSGCRKHERCCWLNPKRKSYATCNNLYDIESHEDPFGIVWKCSQRDDVVPFKVKIDQCPNWHESGAIFTNDAIKYNRPIERKEK